MDSLKMIELIHIFIFLYFDHLFIIILIIIIIDHFELLFFLSFLSLRLIILLFSFIFLLLTFIDVNPSSFSIINNLILLFLFYRWYVTLYTTLIYDDSLDYGIISFTFNKCDLDVTSFNGVGYTNTTNIDSCIFDLEL